MLFTPWKHLLTGATAVFSNHLPPPPIVDVIGSIAPRPVFLIYAAPGMGGEDVRQPKYFAAAEAEVDLEGARSRAHGGIDARPLEFERRVIEFYDGLCSTARTALRTCCDSRAAQRRRLVRPRHGEVRRAGCADRCETITADQTW